MAEVTLIAGLLAASACLTYAILAALEMLRERRTTQEEQGDG